MGLIYGMPRKKKPYFLNKLQFSTAYFLKDLHLVLPTGLPSQAAWGPASQKPYFLNKLQFSIAYLMLLYATSH